MTRSYFSVSAIAASAAIALVVLSLAGCSRDLTRREADRIVSENPKAAGVAPVSTEGISKTSDSEAITKTRIGEAVFNLKFRRYDSDWKWEFVETKAGSWIAAEQLLDELQEKRRVTRAEAWAAEHIEGYTKTIDAMSSSALEMPARGEPFEVESWTKLKLAKAL